MNTSLALVRGVSLTPERPVRLQPTPTAAPPGRVPAASDLSSERRIVGLAFVALLATMWPTLVSFPGTWLASYHEHGFFVGGLVAWLIWRDRHRAFEVGGPGMADLLPIVALLSLAWMCAVVMNIRLIHQFLAVLLIAAWAFATFGWSARRLILALSVTFLLALPLGQVAVPFLQKATVIASGGATRLAGISAVIGAEYITISTGTFLVEEGCSGINYLMGGLTLGAIYAHLFCRDWRTQLKIVALAGLASMVGNWIRVSVLIFIGEATAMQSDLIGDHLWQGWAIFTLLMVPTYLLAQRIERAEGAAPAVAAETPGEPRVFGGRARGAVLAAALAAVGPIGFMLVGAVPRSDALDRDFASLGLGGSAPDGGLVEDAWSPDYVGVDERATWLLEAGGQNVEASRHFFIDQRQGEELIQFANSIAPDSLLVADRLIGPVGRQRRFVREALVRGPGEPRVVWYWYRVAGFETPFASKAKLLEVLSFVRRSAASELVTLTARCRGESCTDAAQALHAVFDGGAASD